MGGESGRTDTEAVPVEVEIERVVPVVERLAADGRLVSVDTWRGPVAKAALAAGAAMVNDVSGLSDESVAAACAEAGAALVITHTLAPPKTKVYPDYEDVVAEVGEFLLERMAAAREAGVAEDSIVLDPGIDIAKTPGPVGRAAAPAAGAAPSSAGRCCWRCRARTSSARSPSARRPRATPARSPRWAPPRGAARASSACTTWPGARDYLRVRDALRSGADDELELAPELRREIV